MIEGGIPLHGSPADRLRAIDDLVRQASDQFDRVSRSDDRDREAAEERARAARAGALGTDWQRIQQQIDLGRTSLRAVFDGTDSSPHAERLRQKSRTTLTEAYESAESGQQVNDPATAVVSEIAALGARLRALTDEERR